MTQHDAEEDGSVWVCGNNVHGQLGDGSPIVRHSFVRVISLGAKTVVSGLGHSMVLKQNGSVWATGVNTYGQNLTNSSDRLLI